MEKIIGIVFILLAAWAVLSLRHGSGDNTANPALTGQRFDTTILQAPVKCGPYFLYIHPSYFKKDRYSRGAERYIVFSVTRTPPEEMVDTIDQLWAYGVSQHTIATQRPNLFDREIHKRTDMRPAMFKDIGIGDYIGDYFCKPYRPLDLQCSDNEPWCGPPRPKKPPPKRWAPPPYG